MLTEQYLMYRLDLSLFLAGSQFPFNLSETLEIVGVGFMFVLFVLALLALITAALGAVFMRFDAKTSAGRATADAVVPAQAVIPIADSEALDGEEDAALLAVIATAGHSVMSDQAHRIVSIRSDSSGWAQEGRRAIFSSHHVR